MDKYVPKRLTGRCLNGFERDGGKLYHAVPERSVWGKALCGAGPGRRSNGWSDYIGEEVTCKRCLKKLNKKRCCK